MMVCRQVAPDVWLGFASCATGAAASAPGDRWRDDREAADRALAAAVAVSGFHRGDCATSRSHTRGAAAAVVAPGGIRIGVDLVAVERVRPRHARAVLSDHERETLARHGPVYPALAWAVKEAAAKAAGDPIRRFPQGLTIEEDASGLVVRAAGLGRTTFEARWGVIGCFLCAWVRERDRGPMHGCARSDVPCLSPGSPARWPHPPLMTQSR